MARITDIMLLAQPEQSVLMIENQGDVTTLSRLIGEGFLKIDAYLKELGELPVDIPFVEYPAYEEMSEKEIKMLTGFYTSKSLPGKGDIRSVVIPTRKVAVCLNRGSYNELAKLYEEMEEWIKEKGLEAVGASIEHYYTGPETPKDEQITRLVMPLK